MKVQVGIKTQGPPTKERLEVLRSAATRFENDKASIRVTHEPNPDCHCLIARFTMTTTAQYKVVDDIAAGFKMDIWEFKDYLDMWIAFPKTKAKSRGKSHK